MNWLLIIIAIVSILLIALVLLQKANSDGAGLGGGDSIGGINNKKRGFEKKLFQITIVLAIAFIVFNLLSIFIG